MLPGEAVIISDEYYDADAKVRESGLWSEIDDHEIEKVVRYGPAASTIAQEAQTWRADLLVVASHGKGWMDRLLVGSTSEQLLHHPPTLTLMVPAARAALEPLAVGALQWEENVPAAAPA